MVAISNLLNKGLLLVGQSIYADVATPQQSSVQQYNILNFLGGAGPYIANAGFGIDTSIPQGCSLEQVQLLSRHGERYPTSGSGKKMEEVYEKIKKYNGTLKGDLTFFNDYTFFVHDKKYYGLETTTSNSEGTYAGTTNELRHGAVFRAKYGSLYEKNSTLPVFTSNSNRVHESSKYFARGFLGDEYEEGKTVVFNILSEEAKSGLNSLTPRHSCPNNNDSTNDHVVAEYDTKSYLKPIVDRLTKPNPGLNLTTSDVENMFPWCAYEINVNGSSQVCDLFTNEEFIKNSYASDLSSYYSNGPGNNYTRLIGSVLLNASLALLKDESAQNKIWLSFSHDTDLENYHSALGLIKPKEDLPTSYIPFPHNYLHSAIVPQGARIYTEKFKCGKDSFVRYVINDAVIPIESCASGPGFSCKFDDFEQYINKRIGDVKYTAQCGTNSSTPQQLSFYWDYKTTKYDAPLVV
ncbi:uncharacterized protein LODBEIA_P43130 [Lodderomyces beijingensis]|uniref:Acid phosphatase n=1 Tax=Lodderomyces beijingensis TaxID=1775926 RepID=A0ABP0ZPL9_9ASCO